MSAALGLSLTLGATVLAFAGLGMTGHMAAHMGAVAVAAPALASALPRRPRGAGAPLLWAMVEFAIVWAWHFPALRALADAHAFVSLAEQALFLAAGVALWRAALAQPAAGAAALLLTSMHMTLLGALVGLAPRTLYGHSHGLQDQQLGGVVMLMVGAGSYLLGGLAMLGTLLTTREARA